MKRTIAAGLSAALLCGMVVPAFAADTKTATNTTGTIQTQPTAPVKLTFDKLEETVRQNNVTIKANNNTVLSAEKTDVSDQYIESYFQLSEQISSYQKQIKELQKTLKELGTDKANAVCARRLRARFPSCSAIWQPLRLRTGTSTTTRTTQRKIRRKRLITPAVRCRMQPMRSA